MGSPFLRERLWAIQKGRPLLGTCVYKFCADHLYVMEGASWYFLGGILGRQRGWALRWRKAQKEDPSRCPSCGVAKSNLRIYIMALNLCLM